MAQVATQQVTGATRFKGPTVITLRGAGSAGHDPLTKGAGLDVGLSVELPSAQTANGFQLEKPDGTVISALDAAGGLVLGSALNISKRVLRTTLTAAQIITLNSVPVALLAAPGATKAYLVEACVFQMIYGTVQFTGGGAINPVYTGATTNLLGGSVAAATVQAAANATISCGAPATALSLTTNTGVSLRAATADFAAGDSTAVVTLWYSLITLG